MDFGLYHIVDPARNTMVAGGYPFAYSMSLDEVEVWLTSEEDDECP